MIKIVALWEREPPAERYARHLELAKRVPGARVAHGKIFGSPSGEPDAAHYAELEFPNRESFERALRSEEFQATGKDAAEFGIPLRIYFAEVS